MLDSPIHRISPGFKLLSVLLLIVSLSVLPEVYVSVLSIIVVILLFLVIYISKVPLVHIVKRTLIILPLIIPVIILNSFFTDGGISRSLVLSVRSFLSILSLILLVSVTGFRDLMRTLSRWHFPQVLIMILSFMYRYFFLLTDEMEKMVRAVKMRTDERGGIRILKVYGRILAILFIKSYERSERVYYSMVMRGYDGNGGLM